MEGQKLHTDYLLLGGWSFKGQLVFLIHVTFSCFLQKKTYDEQKFAGKKADGTVSSDIKTARGSHCLSFRADSNLKSGKSNELHVLC